LHTIDETITWCADINVIQIGSNLPVVHRLAPVTFLTNSVMFTFDANTTATFCVVFWCRVIRSIVDTAIGMVVAVTAFAIVCILLITFSEWFVIVQRLASHTLKEKIEDVGKVLGWDENTTRNLVLLYTIQMDHMEKQKQ
jgi:hypothetical protein